MKITGSGRISETVFTTEGSRYEDEPVMVYTLEGVAKLMLPQELQSTGDDQFAIVARTGMQPAPGADSHRLEAIEPFVRRGVDTHPGTATLTIAPVTSNILDEPTGTPGASVAIPVLEATSQPVKVPVGVWQTARWLGFSIFGDNTNCIVRYLGAILRGRRLT